MTINQLAESTPARRFRSLLTTTGAIGTGYALSWIAGLSLPAPSPALNASGAAIVSAYSGHEAAVAVNFALTEGLPAVGIAVISLALARATGGTRGRVLRAAGLVATVISVAEFVLGLILVKTQDAGSAQLLWATVDRIDGLKMFAFAVLGAAAYGSAALPRWLRYTGAALAVTMAASGVAYLMLMQSAAIAAGPALLALLVLIAGAGITLGAKARPVRAG
jgi:hypothetical protein